MSSATRDPVPGPEVEVRRSARRKRSVQAYRDGDKVIVLMPARISRAEETKWVDAMLARSTARTAGARPATRT